MTLMQPPELNLFTGLPNISDRLIKQWDTTVCEVCCINFLLRALGTNAAAKHSVNTVRLGLISHSYCTTLLYYNQDVLILKIFILLMK